MPCRFQYFLSILEPPVPPPSELHNPPGPVTHMSVHAATCDDPHDGADSRESTCRRRG